MQQRVRVVVLYTILGICVVTVLASVITKKQPPEAVYGLLDTFGAYVIFGQDGIASHRPAPPPPQAPPPDPEPPVTPAHDSTGADQ